MMDINYELYKVFYHVATTLNFSEASKAAVYFTVCCQPVAQNTQNGNWIRRFLSEAQNESPAHTGRRDSPAPH